MTPDDEEELLRSVATQNAASILLARQRAEQELLRAKEGLEVKTQALAHSLARLRATLESTSDAILVTDECGHVTDVNQQCAALWNLPGGRVEARHHREILEHVARLLYDPVRLLTRTAEIEATSPDDSLDVLELTDGRVVERHSKIQRVDGRNVGRVWSFRDVTQDRRAEEALHDEARLLELLNRTGVRISSQLELQALAQAVTDAATELTGARVGAFFYTVPGAGGDSFTLLAFAGASGEALERLGELRAPPLFGSAFRGEGPVRCDDLSRDVRHDVRHGEAPSSGVTVGHLPVRSYLAVPVVSGSGEVIGGLVFGHPEPGVFTGRTERMVVGIAVQAAVAIDNARMFEAAQRAAEERRGLLERERLARAEAERASAMKDEFLATLSHELRTPLNAILGWAQILRSRPVAKAELDHALEVMERNARAQTQLIEDLLDMSRITSGQMRLDVQPVDPVSFIEAALETVRPAANAKGIRLTRRLDPAAGPITGDPNRLQQVVWNLLSNAIKFTEKNGWIEVRLERADSHVDISVADTGIGIAPWFLPQVFDRFRQADPSQTRTAMGLGLGLSIVKHLVEMHGGTVRVASPGLGRGATFTVRLPLAVVPRAGDDRERVHPRRFSGGAANFERVDLSGLKVLVVDDQADARDLLTLILATCAAEVLTASTAAEALDVVEAARPDVLVSDIGMPDVDGYELLRRVRALGPARGGRLPAIALTAFARSEDRTRALHSGFLAHVAKPVEASELVATVASVVGRTGDPGRRMNDRPA